MGAKEKGTIRLEIPSRIDLLETARQLVDQVAKSAGFDEDGRQDIQAAVHESLVNAIRHGNREDRRRRVVLEVDPDPHCLEIRVRDEGEGFDPSRIPDPLALENLCNSSGRGILLMRALMDGVGFRRLRGGGMEVTMRKAVGRDVEGRAGSSASQAGSAR
jgi:serine/threonine-protein kinase RsbW